MIGEAEALGLASAAAVLLTICAIVVKVVLSSGSKQGSKEDAALRAHLEEDVRYLRGLVDDHSRRIGQLEGALRRANGGGLGSR